MGARRPKCLKMSIQIQKDATYDLDRKKINLITNKSFRYHNLWSKHIMKNQLYTNVAKDNR